MSPNQRTGSYLGWFKLRNPNIYCSGTTENVSLGFQLTVTNEEGVISDLDEVTVNVSPVSASPPNDEPRTNRDIIKGIIQNPLDPNNSIESANKIINLLTDNNPYNDQRICNLLDQFPGEQAIDIQNTLKC